MNDLTYSLRTLRKSPGFTLTAVLTLGLGLGASVAVFSIVNAIYFAALPYRDVDRLVMIETSRSPTLCRPLCPADVAAREVEEWKQRLTSIDAIAGLSARPMVVATSAGPEWMRPAVVSANLFPLLGLRSLLGRTFVPADAQPAASPVVVLSHRYWMESYGGDSSIVGRSLVMDTKSYQIVGVMPPSAKIGAPLFSDSTGAALFVPLQDSNTRLNAVVAHLVRDRTPEQLHAALDAIVPPPDSASVRQARAEGFAPTWKTRVTPLRTAHARSYASVYPLVLGTVLLVVLIACANLALLFLARFGGRRHEAMVRSALGAGRGRLVRLFVTEGMIVAGAAVTLGSLVAPWAVSLTRLFPGALPYWAPARLDLRVALFALALAALCGAAFSLIPALLVTHVSGAPEVGTESRAFAGGRTTSALRRVLIGAEIACSLLLLTGAGLLVKTFIDVATADVGAFAKRSVLMGAVGDQSAALETWTPGRRLALAPRLVDRLKAVPGVAAAAVSANVAAPPAAGITRDGENEMTTAGAAWIPRAISADYFGANGTTLISGRAFTDADNQSGLLVGIIDEETAKHVFPGEPAIGRRLKLGPPASNSPWITIVGVVASSGCPKTDRCAFRPILFRPIAQSDLAPMGFLTFFVRTLGPDELLKPAIRAAVRDADPTVVVMKLFSAESRWEDVIAPLRANAVVLGGFALFALIIAALGTYGVLAYLVTQRTAEIGIRIALGATQSHVRWLVLRSVMITVLAGLAIGAAGSFALTRLLRSMLYATSPTDPLAFAAAALTLVGVAVLAAYLPARRAMRVDPMIALRST